MKRLRHGNKLIRKGSQRRFYSHHGRELFSLITDGAATRGRGAP